MGFVPRCSSETSRATPAVCVQASSDVCCCWCHQRHCSAVRARFLRFSAFTYSRHICPTCAGVWNQQ